MATRRRPYIGRSQDTYELIMADHPPRPAEYPHIGYVVGPFRTKRDALHYCASGDAWNRPTPNSLSYRAPHR